MTTTVNLTSSKFPSEAANIEFSHDVINEPPSIGTPGIVEGEAVISDAASCNNTEEAPLQSTVTFPSESSNTKARFRAARAVTPGAIAASSTHGTDTSIPSESGTLPDIVGKEDEHSEFESYLSGDDDATTIPAAVIVTAEVVEGDTMMHQSERKRIMQEAIQTITDQAVAAEVVDQDSDKSSRKYRTVILILISVVIVVVVVLVLVIVLTTRSSDSPKDITGSPTLSPTPFLDDSVFRTMEQLYQAVDAYRMLSWNESNQSSFQTSDVALRYGYPISSWNVSLVKNFSYEFDPSRFSPDIPWEFNEDLGDWDVSNAEAMVGMFANAYEFQGIGLENWNVSKVKDFSYMFSNSGFIGTISEWDTSNAEVMNFMFRDNINFNSNLSLWDVSRVHSMFGLFSGALSFEGIGLEHWNVHSVRDFTEMFSFAHMFNGSLSGWNTSSAETMQGLFNYASIFNDNLSLWDVSRVTNMITMFSGAAAYAGDGIASWDVSKVEAMEYMFAEAVLFDGDVSNWDVSQLLSLSFMVSALEVSCHLWIFISLNLLNLL